MARPIKRGLDYFQTDTALFTDRKIRKLIKTHGAQAYSVFTYMLCEIYKDNGYYLQYNNDLVFDIADTMYMTENDVDDIIMFCIVNTLFDQQLFALYGILTSHGIQRRYMAAKSRKPNYLDTKFLLVPNDDYKPSTNNKTKTTKQASLERFTIKQLKQQLNITGWLNQISPKSGCDTPAELSVYFNNFCEHQLLIENEPRTEINFKTHFINWLKIQQSQQQQQPASKLQHNTVMLKNLLNEIENESAN